jgi:hypothetical protein
MQQLVLLWQLLVLLQLFVKGQPEKSLRQLAVA